MQGQQRIALERIMGENTINTAVKFGMNIRVTVERGDAISACWVSSIGGNFE